MTPPTRFIAISSWQPRTPRLLLHLSNLPNLNTLPPSAALAKDGIAAEIEALVDALLPP
jgi:hypothetical protein